MKNSLAKNAIFNTLYKILNVVFPLFSATYVARVLLPEGIGKISYVQNIVSYFSLIAALGIPIYGVREISKCRDNQKETNKIFTEIFLINFISTLLCSIIFYSRVFLFETEERNLYIICGLVILLNFLNIDWFYQGKEEYTYIAIRSSLIKLFALIALFFLVKEQKDYLMYALITSVATGGNYIFNIIHVRKYVKLDFSNLDLRHHMKSILMLVVCTLAVELYSKVDILMLGNMCDYQIVGYYTNAHKLVNLVLTFTTSISAIFLPRISYYYQTDKKSYQKFVTIGLNIALFFSTPCFFGLILVADQLVYVLFGTAFLSAVPTIQILSVLVLIKSLGDIACYQVIVSSGKEKTLVIAYIAAASVNVLLNMFLIPQYHQNGAAVASVISEFLANGILLLVSSRVVKLRLTKRMLASVSVGIVAMVAGVAAVNLFIDQKILSLACSVAIGCICYVVVNFFCKNEVLVMITVKLKSILKRG